MLRETLCPMQKRPDAASTRTGRNDSYLAIRVAAPNSANGQERKKRSLGMQRALKIKERFPPYGCRVRRANTFTVAVVLKVMSPSGCVPSK